MADTGARRDIKVRTDAKEEQVVADSKKLLQSRGQRRTRYREDAAASTRRKIRQPADNKWLSMTHVRGLEPFSRTKGLLL
jgi:hypothetical protein